MDLQLSHPSTSFLFLVHTKESPLRVDSMKRVARLRTSDSILIQSPEINRHQSAHTRFLHRNTIDDIHSTHRHFIVGNDDKLGILTELANHIGEFPNIRIIERRIHLVEYTERRGFNKVNCE